MAELHSRMPVERASLSGEQDAGGGTRGGGLLLVLLLAVALVGAAVTLSVMRRDEAEPFVLALLAFFSVIGVVALFAGAIGLLRVGERKPAMRYSADIVEALGEGLVVTAPNERVLYANDTYMVMSGSDADSVPATVPRAFAAHPDANDPMYRLAQAARENRQWQEEFRIAGLDEKDPARWYRVSVQPLLADIDGNRPAKGSMVWRVAEVTQERARQENFFLELQQVIDYLDHAPSGFFSARPDGGIQYMNATLAGWLGLDLTQTLSGELSVPDIVSGDSGVLLNQTVPVPGELRSEVLDLDLKRRDGTPLPVRLLHGVSFATDGKPGYSRTLVINRSHGEDVAEDLRAAEVRFARFFNNAPIAIATVNAQGRIMRANSGFVQMQAQIEPENRAQVPLLDLIVPDDRMKMEQALAKATANISEIPPVDVTLVGQRGLSARFFLSPVRDAEAAGEAALVYAIDTSAQRALEIQFAQGQKMQAVGQLAGGVAHDFNNVLTAIIGYSDLLLMSHRPSDPAFQDIMNIKQSANRAAGLVRQLLAFSRQQTLRPEVLQLSEAISDLSVMLKRLLGEKVELEVKNGRDLWLVKVDLVQLEQVIINLVVNARDAMPDGGKVSVRTANVDAQEARRLNLASMPAADHVLLEVSDNGTGMPPEVMEKIFEPFFSTKEVGKGTGLGLSTVYGIVKQTGGFIFPESMPGKGTSFRIYLPRHVPTGAEEEVKKVEIKAVDVDLTGTGTILLVEDEDAVRAFAARALVSQGYDVLEASNGAEALEVLDEFDGEIALVVSDVVMPEMDGPTMLQELHQRLPGLKVIFMSGYAEDAFRKNLKQDARFAFIHKPFALKDLVAKVKAVLQDEA